MDFGRLGSGGGQQRDERNEPARQPERNMIKQGKFLGQREEVVQGYVSCVCDLVAKSLSLG